MLGVSISPDGIDDAAHVARSRAKLVRLTLKPEVDTRAVMVRYVAAGLGVVLCCDADTERGMANHATAAHFYRQRLQGAPVYALQIGPNEWRSRGPTSTTTSEQQAFDQAHAWAVVWGGVCPLWGPGDATGIPDEASARINALVSVQSIHPYAKSAQEAAALVRAYTARWGKPCAVTEFEWSPERARALLAVADDILVYNWRSWFDPNANDGEGVGWEHGLLDIEGRETYRYGEFRQLAQEIAAMPDPTPLEQLNQALEDIKTLKRQQGIQTRGLAHIGDDKLGPGTDSLAADLVELDPDKYRDWKPAPKA